YAVQQGCQPTAQEVTARVAHDENLMTGGKAADRSLYTSIYGPDYWTMTYPDVIRRLLAKNRLNASLTASLIPPPFSTAEATAPATAWNSLAWRVVQQAHITVKNQTAIAPASVSAALKYLKNYYAAGFGS
ncbi:MAG TPA: hypothetical protein VKU87_06400, partial [Thermomicrobiaceae bacterium]|nr:hypothetical protein [Thermomicrobiaceae bacterium]